MMKFSWIQLPLLALGLLGFSATGVASTPQTMDWSYMVGSNADEIWHTKANFYHEGKLIHSSSNGDAGYVGAEALREKDYRWRIGAGRKLYNQPIPDKVDIEWVSFHDKKRYGITLMLPSNLNSQIEQGYWILNAEKRQEVRRNIIALGLAPGGYVEVFLTKFKVKPDVLLARGIAKEIRPWQDEKVPLSKQFNNAFAAFDKDYGATYLQHPIPQGMDWAPIMDAYRAKQPHTDNEPVN
ncbi:DUF2931 family protein [Aeromonas dhakensis]|uniref:DUF2931 family protein n=1 Tax=Aeromonas dhakensis TaxID=196024 RepID=UPI00398631F1